MAFINGQEILFATLGAVVGNDAIIECDELPTANINYKAFYLVPDGLFWNDGEWHEVTSLDEIPLATQLTGSDVRDANGNLIKEISGIPGFIKLYNRSSGLELDALGRLCVAYATDDDIKTGVNKRNPIGPGSFKLALETFLPNISSTILSNAVKSVTNANINATGTVANLPPSTSSVKGYVDTGDKTVKDFVTQNLLNFKIHMIEKGEKFEVKPGMLALVLPYTTTLNPRTLTSWDGDNNPIVKNDDGEAVGMGATIIFSTDKVDGTNHWMAMMYVTTLSMSSNHNIYSKNCFIRNDYSGNEGSGRAYVYYLERN